MYLASPGCARGDACDAFGHTVRRLLDTLDAESLGPRPKMAEVQAEDWANTFWRNV